MTMQSPVGISVSERRWDRRRRIGIAMITASGVLFLAGLWLAVTAVMARNQLNQIRADAHTLSFSISASTWPAARAVTADLRAQAVGRLLGASRDTD